MMAEMKVPDKNKPSSFNAGESLRNNRVPSADQKTKGMSSTGDSATNDKKSDKPSALKNGADDLKRNLKKEAIALGVQAASGGAIDRNVTKQALNNKLGNKLVDSMQTPGEKYNQRKEKIRQKRMANGEEADYPMLWFDALSPTSKILLILGFLFFIGMIYFISIFASIFENENLLKAQSFGYISSQNAGNSISHKSSFADKFKSIFGRIIIGDYENIGNVFTSSSECSGDECKNRAEVLYYQKVADLTYRYKQLYGVDLDWPLLIATNLIRSNDLEASFEANNSTYGNIKNLTQVIELDYEYDYENIEGYQYLDADDSRYDLQILAKNMVKKTTVQSCVQDNKVLKSTTLYDVLNKDLGKDSENYLVCDVGTYQIKTTYELDMQKYDAFLDEYIEKKHLIKGSGSGGSSLTPIPTPEANSLAEAFVSVAKNQLNNTDNSIYWKYMGYNSRVPWCAAFVAWVSNNTQYNGQSLYPGVIRFKSASAAAYMRYFIDRKEANTKFYYNDSCSKYNSKNGGKYTPKPGDLIFFDWQRSWDGDFEDIQIGNGVIDHIGIVERVEGNVVYTIEGNSSDKVRNRHYTFSDCRVVGYGSWY